MSISPKELVRLRRERGWSQEKLAAVACVSERTIQRAERDGSCSLDTKMAIATAFEVPPSEMVSEFKEKIYSGVDIKTSWGGVIGLFVLGLAAPLMAILTATEGEWEVASLLIVWGFTIILTVMNYGGSATYKLFDNSSWIVKYPKYVRGLNKFIVQAKSVIEYAYIVGVVSTIVTALAIVVHAPSKLDDLPDFVALVVRPLFYAILFVELWFRPYKKKMESMLIEQASTD